MSNFSSKTNVILLKKAQQLGNDYSDDYCKKSISRQFLQKKLDLIKLVDEEIVQTNEKLNCLRTELANINKSKGSAHRNALLEKSIQVDFPREVAVQVDFSRIDDQLNEPNKQTKVQHFKKQYVNNDSVIKSCPDCNYENSPPHLINVVLPKKLASQNTILPCPDQESQSHSLGRSNNKVSYSEARYLNKIQRIMQNRSHQSKNFNKMASEPTKCSQINSSNKDQFASFIADKVCNKLKDFKPVEETDKKIYRSVAVETTLPLTENEFNINGICEETISRLNDDTIYLNLPPKLSKIKEKCAKTNKVTFEPTEMSFNSTLTSYYEPEKKRSDPLFEIDLIKDNNKLSTKQNKSQTLTFDDISCNTSMFKTLPEISSNCSTPKRNHSPVQHLRSSLLVTPNSTIFNNFSANTLNTDFTVRTSMNMSTLDRNQFWKEVFGNAGVDWSKDISNIA